MKLLETLSLSVAQSKMKSNFDKNLAARFFHPGERVLVLLPVLGSALQAKFCGPYVVDRKLSETDYVIKTPDHKKKTRVCHINMLTKYVSGDNQNGAASALPAIIPVSAVSIPQAPYVLQNDGLRDNHTFVPGARLKNSEILVNLNAHLAHLSNSTQELEAMLLCLRTSQHRRMY